MKRFIFISAALTIALAALATAIWVFAFHTAGGRALIISKAEPAIADALGGEARIGSLEGDLPGALIIKDIVLSDPSGDWARIGRVEIKWRPITFLLNRKLDVDRLHVDDAVILRPPPGKPEAEKQKSDPFDWRLPDNLPDVSFQDVQLTNLQSALSGASLRLDGGGAFSMGGRAITATFTLTSEDNLDDASIVLELQPDNNRLYVDASVIAEPGGVIAAFADLEEAFFLEAKADNSVRHARLDVASKIGAYGDFNAAIAGDLETLSNATIEGVFSPGRRLRSSEELSAPIKFDLALAARNEGARLVINRIAGAFGELEGAADWDLLRGRSRHLRLSASAALDSAYRPDIQNKIGETFTLTSVIEPDGETYLLSGDLAGEHFTFSVKEMRTDLKARFSGEIAAEIAAAALPKETPAPALLNGAVTIDLNDAAVIERMSLVLADQSAATATGRYDFKDQTIDIDGDVAIQPATIAAFDAAVAPRGAMDADYALTGKPGRYTLRLNAETPQLRYNESLVPPLEIAAAFAGLPDTPSGEITARAANGAPGVFQLALRSSTGGRIEAPKILYQGDDFMLNGAGAFDREKETVEINLAYQGGPRAAPWPGLRLTGVAAINGAVSTSDRDSNLTVRIDALDNDSFLLKGLAMNAAGPPQRIALSLRMEEITTQQTGPVENFTAEAVFDIREKIISNLTKLEGLAINNAFSLRQSARVEVENGVSVEGFKLNWGREGKIDIDGHFAPNRWRAEAALKEVNIPGADGVISADIALDTDQQSPARANVSLRSLIAEEENDTIAFNVFWDGETLVAVNAAAEENLDMRLSLPAQLIKSPTLSVALRGDLGGYLRYDGPIEPFAAYFPPELQTLEGKLNADFTVSGSTSSPEVSGSAAFSEGAFTELQTGLSISGLHTQAQASYNRNGSTISFTGGAKGAAQATDDTITLQGEIFLSEQSRLDLKINFQNAELSAHPVDSVRANGAISIVGPFNAVAAKGDISIEELNAEIIAPESTGLVPIEVVSREATALAYKYEEDEPKASPTTLAYAINVVADDRIFIRGRGLESEWAANVAIQNIKNEALVIGDVSLRRGWLDFSGRRFDLTRGRIAFDRLSTNNPILDIRAEYETNEGVTAVIAVSGRAKEPRIELTSTPVLPSNDVMALVLFGKPADSLSAVESLQTAQALASLGGIGPFGGQGLTGSLRQATGLDLLNFDIDPENGGGSLTVGKYVADGLFVSASQDAKGASGTVRVEYELSDQISIETEVRQDGDQTVSANWKRDF